MTAVHPPFTSTTIMLQSPSCKLHGGSHHIALPLLATLKDLQRSDFACETPAELLYCYPRHHMQVRRILSFAPLATLTGREVSPGREVSSLEDMKLWVRNMQMALYGVV